MRVSLFFVVASTLAAAPALLPDPADGARIAALQAQIEGPQSPDRQGLDGYTLDEVMRRFRVPGASVAVISDFRVHWARGYGVADSETGAPVRPETLFQAASISKPITAMAVMKTVQEGRLSLDEDVNRYLRSWMLDGGHFIRNQPVTLRALLSHTSGTGDGFGFPGYHPAAPLPSVIQILNGERPSNVGRVFLERPPYTAFKYSGGGTMIVQLALTETLDRPFPEIMRETVLDPLGMTRSGYEQPLPPAKEAGAARAHGGGAPLDAKWHVYPELAAAGLWTTPSELAAAAIEVQRALAGRATRLLTRASAAAMTTPVGAGDFGVGFVVTKQGQGWYFGHGGSNRGFRCDLVAHRLKGYGVVVMTNSDSGGPVIEEIKARVASAYGWDWLDKPVPR